MKFFLYEDEQLLIDLLCLDYVKLKSLGSRAWIHDRETAYFIFRLNCRKCSLSQQHILGPRLGQELSSESQNLICQDAWDHEQR